MVVGPTLEIGQNVQLPVEEEIKPEQEPALTLLQPMVVQIVMEKALKLSLVIIITVQVENYLFVILCIGLPEI